MSVTTNSAFKVAYIKTPENIHNVVESYSIQKKSHISAIVEL